MGGHFPTEVLEAELVPPSRTVSRIVRDAPAPSRDVLRRTSCCAPRRTPSMRTPTKTCFSGWRGTFCGRDLSVYETEGHRFESCLARETQSPLRRAFSLPHMSTIGTNRALCPHLCPQDERRTAFGPLHTGRCLRARWGLEDRSERDGPSALHATAGNMGAPLEGKWAEEEMVPPAPSPLPRSGAWIGCQMVASLSPPPAGSMPVPVATHGTGPWHLLLLLTLWTFRGAARV